MLRYQGHIFDASAACKCCVTDAVVKTDPTGTAMLRRRFKSTLALRWRSLRVIIRQMVLEQDLLQLKPGFMNVTQVAIMQGGTKVQSFQRFLDNALESMILGRDGSVMRPLIERAYSDGERYAVDTLGQRYSAGLRQHRVDALFQLGVIELQGIMEAVSQQAVRAVANGLLEDLAPSAIVKSLLSIVDKIGITRSDAMAEFMVVRAFNEATLDIFAAAGITQVGLVPESYPKLITGDARKRTIKPVNKGPGSRVSREATPSASTIARIRRAEERIERMKVVNVRTAEDDKVCSICEEIAENGPYAINTARGIIPAHPRCRCAFIPANDKRFKENRTRRRRAAKKSTGA